MKTLLVTGGAGFVGGHLISELLDRGYRVVCYDLFTYAASLSHLADAMANHPCREVDRVLRRADVMDRRVRLVVLRGDLNDTATLVRLVEWCDGVVALAAETHVDYSYHAPEIFVRANVNGVQSLLEALRLAGPGKRLLHVSTDEVYGEVRCGCSTETAALNPRNIYAASKACGELLVRTYAQVYGLDVVTARPSNMFGPRQQPNDLIPKTFARLLAGKKIPIHGDGRHVREYLFVGDAAKILAELYVRGRSGEIYNLSSNVFRSTLQVVNNVARSLNLRPRDYLDFVEDRPNPDRRYASDNTRIRRLMGRRWRLTPFPEAIRKMRDEFVARSKVAKGEKL